MRVRMTRESLARQIPALKKAILTTLDQDEYIYLEAQNAEKESALLKEFPDFINIFSRIQLKFLEEMYRAKGPVRVETLKGLCGPRAEYSFSNGVDVHIRAIRIKLKKNKLPFEIRTIGTHQLRELVRIG